MSHEHTQNHIEKKSYRKPVLIEGNGNTFTNMKGSKGSRY